MIRAMAPSIAWQRFIERRYGLQIDQIKPLDSLYQPNTATWISTPKGCFVVKRYPGTQEALHTLYRRVQELVRRGCKSVPNWLKTLDQVPFVHWQNQLLYVVGWPEGRQFEPTVEDVNLLGRTLAELHISGLSTTGITSISFIEQRRRKISRALLTIRREGRFAADPDIESWFRLHRTECILWLEKTEDELRQAEQYIRSGRNLCTLVHGDVTSPNILVTDEGVKFVNWERLGPGVAVEELAKAVSHTCKFRIDLIQAALNGYGDPLSTPSQQLLFRAFFRIPREALHIIELIQRGATTTRTLNAFEILNSTWDDRVHAVEWIDSHLNQ